MIAMVIKSMPFGAQMIKSVLIQLGTDLGRSFESLWRHLVRYLSAGSFCP